MQLPRPEHTERRVLRLESALDLGSAIHHHPKMSSQAIAPLQTAAITKISLQPDCHDAMQIYMMVAQCSHVLCAAAVKIEYLQGPHVDFEQQ